MCSYCGCEAEPLITALMEDHAAIADLAYRVAQALDTGERDSAHSLTAELAESFRVHTLKEESGLFDEVIAAGEASDEVERLLADHRRLRPLLASPGLVDHPARLRGLLVEVLRHAETEDDDLFPYVLQVLPSGSWDRLNGPALQRPDAAGSRVA